MTEDTSPKNLRKFLESDDPAMVRMGLSMAKGIEIPDEMLGEILWMYMLHDDKTIRATAKSIFMKLAPEDAKQAVKENWKPNYRTTKSKIGTHLCSLETNLKSIGFFDLLIKKLEDGEFYIAEALGLVNDKRAVGALIKALEDKDIEMRLSAAEALGDLGDTQAVEPLIKLFKSSDTTSRKGLASITAKALGTIGDERAISPLSKALWNKDVANTLVKFGETSIDKIISQLGVKIQSDFASEILEKIEKTVIPLIKIVNEGNSTARNAAIEALGNIGDCHAVESLISVLKDKDNKLKFSAIEALRKIGDKRAVKPLIETLKDKDSTICLSAAEALLSFTHIREEVQWTDEMPDIIDSKLPYDRSTLKLSRDNWKANPDLRDSLSVLLRISKWKMVPSKHHNEIYQSIIEKFDEEWVIAGLLIWCGSHAFLEETLTVKPNEIVSNHWVHGYKGYALQKSITVSRNSIRKRSGVYRVKADGMIELEICKKRTLCRGNTNIVSPLFDTYGSGKACKENMEKGDLRLGVELPNPNNPRYYTTYYYCVSCVSTYIHIQRRYNIIEKWWPLGLKAKDIADEKLTKAKVLEE